MNSSTTPEFRARFRALPLPIRALAKKSYRLWRDNPRHPSVQFKKVGEYWSVRIGDHYRALGRYRGDTLYWFWIGTHEEYNKLV